MLCMLQGSEGKCGSFLCMTIFKGRQWRQQRRDHAVHETDVNVLSQGDLINAVIFCTTILISLESYDAVMNDFCSYIVKEL